jgi:hypothetical protein
MPAPCIHSREPLPGSCFNLVSIHEFCFLSIWNTVPFSSIKLTAVQGFPVSV